MTLKATGLADTRLGDRRTLGRTAAWLSKQVEIGLSDVDLSSSPLADATPDPAPTASPAPAPKPKKAKVRSAKKPLRDRAVPPS